MAWSSAELSATELANLALDKPIIGASMALGSAVSASRWVATNAGVFADADISHTTGVARRGYDGHTDEQTYPSTSATGFSYLLDFGSTGQTFDAIGLVNHNLDTLGCTAFKIEIADDDAFSTNLQTLVTFNVSTGLAGDYRFLLLSLYHTGATARRYSTVRYVRVSFTLPGATNPKFGEIIFLRRRQLSFGPMRPWRRESYRSNMTRFVADSKKQQAYTFSKGQEVKSIDLQIPDETSNDDLDGFWWQSAYGTRPFVWCYAPSSAPYAFNYMRVASDDPTFDPAFGGPTAREWSIPVEEIGPNFLVTEQFP